MTKAPFIWFGGKRRVADLIWDSFGDVDNYVEPFFGSGAVLLGRPDNHLARCETVNDADCYLSNFWRALAAAPDEVARFADWPVNECDLLARHLWLVNEGKKRIAAMESDPEFYDAKVAGWWVWGINAWIGSGWCVGHGPWEVVNGEVINTGNPGGQWRQLPNLGNAGQGVNRKRPHLGTAGQGVNRKLPNLGNAGRGVNRKLPNLGDAGRGDEPTEAPCLDYFRELADRLRRVRVCCGDWSRIVTNGALSFGESVGVFLDPPYLGDVRTADLYRTDDHTIANEVREWCIANGDNPRLKIALCGYRQEHDAQMPATWRRHLYSASRAYGTCSATGTLRGNDANRHNEAIWFSPACAPIQKQEEMTLCWRET